MGSYKISKKICHKSTAKLFFNKISKIFLKFKYNKNSSFFYDLKSLVPFEGACSNENIFFFS